MILRTRSLCFGLVCRTYYAHRSAGFKVCGIFAWKCAFRKSKFSFLNKQLCKADFHSHGKEFACYLWETQKNSTKLFRIDCKEKFRRDSVRDCRIPFNFISFFFRKMAPIRWTSLNLDTIRFIRLFNWIGSQSQGSCVKNGQRTYTLYSLHCVVNIACIVCIMHTHKNGH